MSDRDTKVFFKRGDEFNDNPLHFAVHRISNMGTYSEVFNAKMRLLKGDTDGCMQKLEKIEKEMVEMIEFLRKFAKEYDEFKEAGNVIIPKSNRYMIALCEIDGEVEEGKTLLLLPDGSLMVHPLYGMALDDIKSVEVAIVSKEAISIHDAVGKDVVMVEKKPHLLIGKAPQHIVDGLISKNYFEGDRVRIKMKKYHEQVRYKDGGYAREYQEVEVPIVNPDGTVICEE